MTPRHPAGQERKPSRGDGEPHGLGHEFWAAGPGDGRGEHHGCTAKLHRDRCVAGGPDPGVEDDGHAGLLNDQFDVVRVADAEPRADWGAQGHHGGTARLLESPGEDGIVVGVRQYREAVGYQLVGGREQLDRVG